MDGWVFFRIFTFHIVFNNLFLNWLSKHVIHENQCKGLDSREKEQKCDEHGTSLQSSRKINLMLITRLICIQQKLVTPDRFASPLKFLLIEILLYFDDRSIYFFQSNQCFRVIELMGWPILEKFDIFSINLSEAFFHKNASLSEKLLYAVSHVACNAAGYQSHCNAYPQFPWSPLGMPRTMTPY